MPPPDLLRSRSTAPPPDDLDAAIDRIMEEDSRSLDEGRAIRDIEIESEINRIMGTPDPDFDITPEDLVARIVGQETLPLGPGGPGSPELRGFLSILGDTPEEQQRAFAIRHPEGELRFFPEFDITVFRTTPDEPFREIDPGFFDSFGLGVAGFGQEVKADIADIMGDVPEILGETAAFFAFRRPGAGQFLRDITMLTAGGAVGETGQQVLQTVAGTQADTFQEQRQRVSGSAALSLIGGTFGGFLGAMINASTGRGLTNVPPEAVAATAAAERLGTLPLLPGQISDVPFIRLLSQQAQALVPKIARYVTEQERRTAAAVRAIIDPAARGRFMDNTREAFAQASEDIVNFVVEGVRLSGTSQRVAGRALEQGVRQWWRASGRDVDNLFNIARSIEPPVYDLAPAMAVAQRFKTGVTGPGATTLQPVTTGPFAGSSQLVRNALGQEVRPQLRLSEMDPRFEAIVNEVLRLSPTGQTTEGLRAIQQNLRDLTVPKGMDRIMVGEAQAIELRSAITDVLTNPTNTTPAFVRAWREANTAARLRFEARETVAVVDVLREGARDAAPDALAARLAQPGQLDNLVVIRRVLNREAPGRWDQFSDAFMTNLLREPGTITARLNAFDAPTLNVLLSRTQQRVMREAGKQIDELASTSIRTALDHQATRQGFVREVMNTNNTASIAAFGDLIQRSGGALSPLGRSSRAAIADEIWARSKVLERGIERVDFNRLQAVMQDFEDRGLLDFLTSADVSILRDAVTVQDFARFGVSGAGTSIQAAEAAAGIRKGGLGAISTFVENITVGRLITSNVGRRMLVGSGRAAPADLRFIRLMGAAAAEMTTSARQEQELGRQFEALMRATALLPGMLVPDAFVEELMKF